MGKCDVFGRTLFTDKALTLQRGDSGPVEGTRARAHQYVMWAGRRFSNFVQFYCILTPTNGKMRCFWVDPIHGQGPDPAKG